jgi:hypothetical protein
LARKSYTPLNPPLSGGKFLALPLIRGSWRGLNCSLARF